MLIVLVCVYSAMKLQLNFPIASIVNNVNDTNWYVKSKLISYDGQVIARS